VVLKNEIRQIYSVILMNTGLNPHKKCEPNELAISPHNKRLSAHVSEPSTSYGSVPSHLAMEHGARGSGCTFIDVRKRVQRKYVGYNISDFGNMLVITLK